MELFAFQKLDVYRASRELVRLVVQAAIRDAELRDHATRAAKSVLLNVAEGLPEHATGARRRHFGIARNSLGELVAAVDAALLLGAVDAAAVEQIFAVAARVKPMIHGLLRRR
jgi:four helix bundle protein